MEGGSEIELDENGRVIGIKFVEASAIFRISLKTNQIVYLPLAASPGRFSYPFTVSSESVFAGAGTR